jgi:hypothetical protein
MATNRYEVVFTVGSSVHVIVEAESKDKAADIAGPIAEEAWGIYVANTRRYDGVPAAADVWLGEVDDLAYVDELAAEPVYADGWSSTFGGSR